MCSFVKIEKRIELILIFLYHTSHGKRSMVSSLGYFDGNFTNYFRRIRVKRL
jgi:hypothetical protein